MADGYNQRLRRLIEEAASAIESGGPPDSALLSELEALRTAFEKLGSHWEEPPESLRAELDELDDNFALATDEYMRVCDLLEESLIERDTELLEEAERTLSKAKILLTYADGVAKERFARWTSG